MADLRRIIVSLSDLWRFVSAIGVFERNRSFGVSYLGWITP
jgi:hypothetical protein